MRKKAQFIKDIFRVSASNIIKLLSGVLVGLLLPKIIGVADYGYYKTYTLYIHYVGLFHFGISDGIYLLYGGKDYDQLERSKFRFYSRFFIVLEAILSVMLFLVSVIGLEGEYRFIFSCVAIYLLANNVTGYYQMISQITGRFKELSRRNVLQSGLIAFSIFALFILHHVFSINFSYKPYTVIYTFLFSLLAIWYIGTYKDITFGESASLKESWKDIPHFIKIGFPLTVANLCSTLILSLDRQFVSILFDTETYAMYAFAYNMLALVTTAVSAISTVLYPKLKRVDVQTLQNNYSALVAAIAVIVSMVMVIYFPLCLFVKYFLQKYIASLPIFRIIFPGLIISSTVTIVMHNYYKVLGLNRSFFIKSVITLAVSGLANFAAYHLWGTTSSISIMSIITMVFWYGIVEAYFIQKQHVKWLRNSFYILTISVSFYLITEIRSLYLGCFLYLTCSLCLTFAFYKNQILKTLKEKEE